MAQEKSKVAQLYDKWAKDAEGYKCEHDVERVHDLIVSAVNMRDFPAVNALAASLVRELTGMNAKQVEADLKEKEEHDKEMAAAKEADRKVAEEANKSPTKPAGAKSEDDGPEPPSDPIRAPSVIRR